MSNVSIPVRTSVIVSLKRDILVMAKCEPWAPNIFLVRHLKGIFENTVGEWTYKHPIFVCDSFMTDKDDRFSDPEKYKINPIHIALEHIASIQVISEK